MPQLRHLTAGIAYLAENDAPPDWLVHKARKTVALNAESVEECRTLLSMLGLL